MQLIKAVWSLTFFAVIVHSSPFIKRQSTDLSAELVDNINTLSNDLTSLNSTLNTFTTDDPIGLLTALKIQIQTSQVSTDLVTCAKTTNASSTFNDTTSGTVATALIDLEPVIFSVLNNIVVHKPAFATAILFIGDISETVEQSLVQQRELSREFSDAVETKLTGIYALGAPTVASDIDSAFATAIAAYVSCSGLVCLPPL